MSIKNNGSKRMYIGKQFINKVFKDRLGNINEDIVIDNEGYGIFKVKSGYVSVYTLAEIWTRFG